MRFYVQALLMMPLSFGCGDASNKTEVTSEPRLEGSEPGDCDDDADNDMDGLFDCDDDGCAGSDLCDEGDSGHTGGSDDTAEPQDTAEPHDTAEPPEPEPTKSPKRGLAYNLVETGDLEAIESGVSWWYNWYFKSFAPSGFEEDHAMEFVPMLWGHNAESDYTELETWFVEHTAVNDLLVMNEPNLVDQANITPADAVSHWLRYEQFQTDMLVHHGRTIRLVGPAITWGTMVGYEDPVVWMDAFLEAFDASEGRAPTIDALAFHWYDYGLEGQLNRLEHYGKSFWVTEMANWHSEPGWTIDTPEKQIETMQDMVSVCESRSDVERYAWFMGRWDPDPHHTSVFGSATGELTAVGEAYLAQPW